MTTPGQQYPDRSIPFWDDGDEITAQAATAVIGARLVKVVGNTTDGTPRVGHCALGDAAFGVAAYSADPAAANPGDHTTVWHDRTKVVEVLVGAGALVAGDRVMSGAAGELVAMDDAAGHVLAGRVLFDAAAGTKAALDRSYI